jgi:hypothetical protein
MLGKDRPLRAIRKGVGRLSVALPAYSIEAAIEHASSEVTQILPECMREMVHRRPGGRFTTKLLVSFTQAGPRFVEVGRCHYPTTTGTPAGTSLEVILRDSATFAGRHDAKWESSESSDAHPEQHTKRS